MRRRRTPALVAALCTTAGLLSAPAAAAAAPAAGGSTEAKIRAAVAHMSLPDKIGQMIVTYAYGDTATTTDPAYTAQNQKLYGVDNGAQLVAKYHLGGVIYFAWTDSVKDPQQTARLSNGLQHASIDRTGGVPLLISIDQEGGVVNRIGAPLAVSPGNMAIGASFKPSIARGAATANGAQLRALGINADDAPVTDVNTNPLNTADGARSFGDRPGEVAALGAAAVSGYHAGGVATSAKHFPGLGSTTVNTDNGVAVSDQTEAQFMANDVPPFRAAIKAGTDTIMAAHIIAPALDPSRAPASLSQPIVTGVLRDKLGYNGLVITDALDAAAVADVPAAERVVRAVKAGVDQLLMPPELAVSKQALVDAVRSGDIPEKRIDASVTRILRVKYARGVMAHPYTDVAAVPHRVGTAGQNRAMATAANRSITLVKNASGTLPLSTANAARTLVTGYGATGVPAVATALGKHGITATPLATGTAPSDSAIAGAVAAAKDNDAVVVFTYNAWNDTAQQKLVKELVATGKRVAVVAVGGPYDIAYFTGAPAYVAAYGSQPASLTAITNTLTGTRPTGRLPVTIPVAGHPDQTLYPYGTGLTYR
ncbi:MAG TPA: glycoside hydrolase family 3 protein [Streptosporangiaceae bacterium]|jgi:beta-N-acetylhexosaminidase